MELLTYHAGQLQTHALDQSITDRTFSTDEVDKLRCGKNTAVRYTLTAIRKA